MTPVVYFNGGLLAVHDARIGVHNGGWLHGAGLFETMRAEYGRVFQLERHLQRICNSSARLLGPLNPSQLPDAAVVSELLARNRLARARVRLTVTAGDMLQDTDGNGADHPLTVCVTASPLSPYPQKLYARGVSVLITRYRQSGTDPLAGHKSTCYLPRLLALQQARAAQCDEALWFTTNNLLAEGSITNVFVVAGGVVSTPPLDTPVLAGTTRALVLDICANKGMETAERALTIDDLLDADEVFLTNSIMQVMPVCRVEKRAIAGGRPGQLTMRLLQLCKERVAEECRPTG